MRVLVVYARSSSMKLRLLVMARPTPTHPGVPPSWSVYPWKTRASSPVTWALEPLCAVVSGRSVDTTMGFTAASENAPPQYRAPLQSGAESGLSPLPRGVPGLAP